MLRGTVNEQFFQVRLKGFKALRRQGPYYVWTRSQGSKTISQRLTSAEAVEQARADIAAYKRFQALCRECIEVTSQMGVLSGRQSRKKTLKIRIEQAREVKRL